MVRFAGRRDIALDPTPYIRPRQLHGIEINPYAAELAQVVIWIGYLQWLNVRGIDPPHNPILDTLQSIENRDAILDLSDPKNPVPAKWPEANFIIGNPPFLGSKIFRKSGLSEQYIAAMYRAFDLPKSRDLCCYWFETGRAPRFGRRDTPVSGLLATQGIRGGENRKVTQNELRQSGNIFLRMVGSELGARWRGCSRFDHWHSTVRCGAEHTLDECASRRHRCGPSCGLDTNRGRVQLPRKHQNIVVQGQ